MTVPVRSTSASDAMPRTRLQLPHQTQRHLLLSLTVDHQDLSCFSYVLVLIHIYPYPGIQTPIVATIVNMSISKDLKTKLDDSIISNEPEGTNSTLTVLLELISTGDQDVSTTQNDSAVTPPATAGLPPLLRVPLEIRHLIFTYFLNVESLETKEISPVALPLDFRPLWICHTLREEGIDYLCKQNRWIQLAVYAQESSPGYLDDLKKSLTFSIPHEVFASGLIALLSSNATLTIRLGEGCGRKKAPDARPRSKVVFAINDDAWIGTIEVLAYQATKYKFMSVDLNPKVQTTYQQLVPRVLIQFAMIRNLTRARFTCMMDKPIFEKIADAMTQRYSGFESWHNYLTGLKEEADHAMSEREEHIARAIHETGTVMASRALSRNYFNLGLMFGAAESSMNTVQSLGADHEIGAARALMKLAEYTIARKGYVPMIGQILEGIWTSLEKLQSWRGMNSEQRMWYHYLFGKLVFHDAELAVRAGEHAAEFERGQETPQDLYRKATKHMFYAADLDMTRVTDAHALLETFKTKTTSFKEPTIVIREIPDYGTWRGDPDFWIQFPAGFEGIYADLSKQEPKIKSKGELRKLKKELGIEWRDEPAGFLRLLA